MLKKFHALAIVEIKDDVYKKITSFVEAALSADTNKEIDFIGIPMSDVHDMTLDNEFSLVVGGENDISIDLEETIYDREALGFGVTFGATRYLSEARNIYFLYHKEN